MIEDSWESTSGNETPMKLKHSTLGYQDSDSYASVSPSPDVDSKTKTFEYAMPAINPNSTCGNLTAALQTEKEFLDFMFSLPKAQADPTPKEKEPPNPPLSSPSILIEEKETKPRPLPIDSPSRVLSQNVGNSSRVGLDHLDNLCRMMEQLGELREQNTRLQKRVQYLEELKTLQGMHGGIENSLDGRKNTLSLGPVSLSDSDLRLDDISDFCLFRQDSEDSLDLLSLDMKTKDDDQLLLEAPDSQLRRSCSDEERRPRSVSKDPHRRASDKEKKSHKSAWGKVKHMISYSKRETVRKKNSSGHPKSHRHHHQHPVKSPPQDVSVTTGPDILLASDPEEYDLDYESFDPDGTSWEWEGECEGGIWIGSRDVIGCESNPPTSSFLDASGIHKKGKPQLTITVPSSEDLSLRSISSDQRHLSEGKISPASSSSSTSKLEQKTSPEIPLTPPSQRRPSNWTKVKQAFLTSYPQHLYQRTNHFLQTPLGHLGADPGTTPPPSPPKKQDNAFTFDEGSLLHEESASGSGVSPEISPEDPLKSPVSPTSPTIKERSESSAPVSGMQKNLVDLQRTLTGEFNKKLQEWERLKSNAQGAYPNNGYMGGDIPPSTRNRGAYHNDEKIPHEFKKKLHEWEKRKNRDKEKIRMGLISGHQQTHSHHLLHLSHSHHGHSSLSYQDDTKTKKHDEEDLPPDFKKKLAEWQIRKALVGKNQQDVEEIQKNLGEEFNRKMAEWERMKAVGQAKPTAADSEFPDRGIASPRSPPSGLQRTNSGGEPVDRQIRRIASRGSLPVGTRLTNLAETAGFVAGSLYSPTGMVRKGSSTKLKKNKLAKSEKTPLTKTESGQKNRDKELQWLEKELNKIDREKQRLEREKEKFLEREARLEKMRHAMKQAPVEKKEIYIKTSNGEFRFEGISQTFTKKLYEWEEQRGIRPESSTFILLDPDYQATVGEKQRSVEAKLTTSRSESSIAEMAQITTTSARQSSLSLNEIDKAETEPIHADNKAASEPTLSAEDNEDPQKCTSVLVDMLEGRDDTTSIRRARKRASFQEEERSPRASLVAAPTPALPPYAPEEITKLIDSSESEENIVRKLSDHKELRRTDSMRSEEEYRSLLHENMTLLGKLKEQETLCRALETQMGDIDNKMDTVADQHLKTLEKLHRHVTIMRKSESFGRRTRSLSGETRDNVDESESNQRLIEQLKARIGELELKGDRLMEDKEQLERAFKLHKEEESVIAESLLMRIRELQEAGAEVNIQTVQCQTEDVFIPDESQDIPDEQKSETSMSKQSTLSSIKKRRRRKEENEKRNEEASDEEKEISDEERESRKKNEKETTKEKKRRKKTPPQKVQRLHNLTADLLFQAKRLEQALVAKHHLNCEDDERSFRTKEDSHPPHPRKRSLKGQSSLRLSKDEWGSKQVQKKLHLLGGSARSWASIEAMISNEESQKPESIWERRAAALASESQELLAMNAELSRMARELRSEMTTLWSLRESTSPDSNSSEDTREEVLMKKVILKEKSLDREQSCPENPDKEDTWLDEEAKNVFESIAALQTEESLFEGSPDPRESPRLGSPIESYCQHEEGPDQNESFEPWRDSHLRFIHSLEKESSSPSITRTEDPEDELTTFWQVPLPRKRKRQTRIICPAESNPCHTEKETPNTVITAPSRKCPSQRNSESPRNDLVSLSDDKVNCKGIGVRDSVCTTDHPLRFFACSSLGSSSTSSLASNCLQQEIHDDHFPTCKDSDEGSSSGTMRTNEFSTLRSEILSSSFEYEDSKKELPASVDHNPGKPVKTLSWERKEQFSEKQLKKVNEMIEEASLRLQREEEGQAKSNKHDKSDQNCLKSDTIVRLEENHLEKEIHEPKNSPNRSGKFQTEVTLRSMKEKGRESVLKTRRVSDTQIHYEHTSEYDAQTNSLPGTRFFSLDSTSCKKVGRQPSIRRNQSESDVLHSYTSYYCQDSDPSSSVFVPTHRTIFKVCRGDGNPEINDKRKPLQREDSIDNSEDFQNERTFTKNLQNSLNNNTDEIISKECERIESDDNTTPENLTKSLNDLDLSKSELEELEDERDLSPSPDIKRLKQHPLSFSISNSSITSKKKALEAANETSPTVKNMIELYNKRITENQELLINPFTPGDPFTNKKTSLPTQREKVFTQIRPKDKLIYKSQSASALSQYISPMNREKRNLSFGVSTEPETAPIDNCRVPLYFRNQPLSLPLSYSTDNSLDVFTSLEDDAQDLNGEEAIGNPSTAQERANKLKKAKEEFLARGAVPVQSKPGRNESFRNRSNTIANDIDAKEIVEATNGMDPVPPTKPPRSLEINMTNIPRKESFRRQSEGSFPDSLRIHPGEVAKSSSSGVLELHRVERSKSRVPSGLPKKPSKSIFRFLKRSKKKEDKQQMTAVQKLCRQSLVVDIGADKRRKEASTYEQQMDLCYSLPNDPGEGTSQSDFRGPRTLPREKHSQEVTPSTRSCPSSPVARHKIRTSWLERGRKIFQSRSPSPNNKPR